jgi:maleate cis-trans isomerase
MGILTGKEVGCIGQDTVLRFTRENDHPEAEAVLVSDTALHGVSYIGQLEISVRKPVLTANLVTMWEALRLVGRRTPQSGLGRLMEVTLEPD